eukprot:GHVL01031151.1.p1 GENE.GHVL01031151.1~~GHVL01031151.1.p1  ORF type:complete len:236 (+),score=26.71 GHVL01031151.1:41-709(+)
MGNSSSIDEQLWRRSSSSLSSAEYKTKTVPFAVMQNSTFSPEDCPFCGRRQKDMRFLSSEYARFREEMHHLDAMIPESMSSSLCLFLSNPRNIPDSSFVLFPCMTYSCPKCARSKFGILQMIQKVQMMDNQCQARIRFHCLFAPLIEKALSIAPTAPSIASIGGCHNQSDILGGYRPAAFSNGPGELSKENQEVYIDGLNVMRGSSNSRKSVNPSNRYPPAK